MSTNQNDHSKVTKENLYASNNYRVPVLQDSPLKSACNPDGFPIVNHRTNSFIVEWQLPTIEMHDTK